MLNKDFPYKVCKGTARGHSVAAIFGKSPSRLLEALHRRKSVGYTPNSMTDGNNIALIFEGGAMSGIYSSAAGTALQELGFTDCFDAVYGTSAGAINAAYFVAGQSRDCTEAYQHEVISKEFMGPFRWPNQIDVDWLAENLVRNGPRKLNIESLQKTKLNLEISMTDTSTGKCKFFSLKEDPIENLVPAIKASGSTPHFTTHQEVIEGRSYNDGVLRAPIATLRAIEQGANMLVVLLTRPKGRTKEFGLFSTVFEYLLRLRFYSARYKNAFFARNAFYNDAFDAIEAESLIASLALAPTSTPLKSLEKRKALIKSESSNHSQQVSNLIFIESRHQEPTKKNSC